ncbi:MAG: hypothetical protein JWN56_1159 [Sphingobacteriales bacterium]|nr:hypothetical protein [Sphingobacteriales bacterium]
MKKLLTITAIIPLLIFSCKKDQSINEGEIKTDSKKYAVKFNVSDFKQSVESMVRKNSSGILNSPKHLASLDSNIGYLYYIAYNSARQEVSRRKQWANGMTSKYLYDGTPSPQHYEEYAGVFPFGSITDSLAAGTYTIVFAGAENEFSINSRFEGLLGVQYLPFSEAHFIDNRGIDSWSRACDSFYKKYSVTVGEQDIEKQVELDRIIGKIEISILDAMPSNADHFAFLFINENEGFKFSTESGFSWTDDISNENYLSTVAASQMSQSNFHFDKMIYNTTTPLDVIIKCYDASNVLIASKTVSNVRCFKNKRTLLSGNFFTTSSPKSSFTVTVNDEWDEEVEEVSF